MKKINTSILLLLAAHSINVHAQIPEVSYAALTPNAAGLGLYGDIPVSLYTGTPDVSIPLYEIKVRDYTLPVTLSYHASGVRVDQHPGWVGLGWNLLAGGLITRNIHDLPDEFDYVDLKNSGYYYNHAVLNTNNWNKRSYLRSIAQNQHLFLPDTTPDEFSFNFAEYSGKFYLDHNRNWVVQCDKPLKVEFDETFFDPPFDKSGTQAEAFDYDWSHCFSGFTITVEDGTKYVFGKNIDAIDFSTDFFTQYGDEWTATAWYLTKIALPWGEDIDLSYGRLNFTNQMYIAVYHDLGTWTEYSGGSWTVHAGCASFSASTAINRYYRGKLMSPVYLATISTPNAFVSFYVTGSQELRYSDSVYDYQEDNFVYNRVKNKPPHEPYSVEFLPFLNSDAQGYPNCLNNLQWCELETIEVTQKDLIYDNPVDLVKTITFHYNNSPNHRLRLDSITESGKRPYKFNYNNFEDMPPYLANKSDHWGFYNNTTAYLNDGNYHNYRNPSAAYTKYGVLTKITYPTGGYTEFDFEPHYYRKQLKENRWETPLLTFSSNQLAGGVRIKSIKHFSESSTSPDITKAYYYVSNYLQNQTSATQSSGILGGQIKYSFDYRVTSNNNDLKLKKNIFSSISVLPSCHNTQGSHIGYTEVIEKMADDSFYRYQFTNFDNGYMDDSADVVIQLVHTPYEPCASRSMERGKMILKEAYDANGHKVNSINVTYEKTDNNYVRAMKARDHRICPEVPGLGYDEGSSYKIYTHLLRPTTETETFYNPENGDPWQTVSTNYAYTNRKLLRSTAVESSNGTVCKTEYKYPFDISGNPVLTQMTNNHHLSPVVEQTEYRNNVFLQKIITNYKNWGNNLFAPEYIKQLAVGQSTPETRITCHHYDSHGNPLYITKDDADHLVYLWGYHHQHPVAEIKNATYAQVVSQIQGGQPTIDAIADAASLSPTHRAQLEALRADLPDAQISTYTYTPLVGLKSMTDPRGVTLHYDYDAFGRLKESYFIENNVREKVEKYKYHYQNQ
jgi:YD repeat-containing protein